MNSIQGTLLITHQTSDLLQLLDRDAFTKPLNLYHGSTVGQHVRHILEFYTCLLEGTKSGMVDYSSRQRNLTLSENPSAAIATLEYIERAVQSLDERQTLEVESEFSVHEADLDRVWFPSSVGRELQYAFDHAVHHLAIIRMGIETCFPHIPVDPELGVAPSTLKYKKEVEMLRI